MIISFDLDDMLIPGVKSFDTISQNLFQKIFSSEKLRLGTIELFKILRSQGHEIYIYTTSYRKRYKIWWMFMLYGVSVNRVINREIHINTLGEHAGMYSKFPPAFNIDVHVDDSKGVETEGKRHNFKTIIIEENDNNWINTVIEKVAVLQGLQ